MVNTDQRAPNWTGVLWANRKLVLLAAVPVLLLVTAALLLFGRQRPPKAVPKVPSDAVQVVVQGLANNQPQVLWYGLPASYQADVRDVITIFCADMDPELYDRAFRILNKAVKLLNEKQNYFAKSAVALSTPMLESSIGKNWKHDVGLLNAFASSDLSSLARLKQMDPGEFLASSGHQLMAGAEDLRLRMLHSPGLNPWEKMNQSLKQGQIEFVRTTNDHGYLRFSSPTNAAKDVAMTQVEGRWVPADLAASWKSKVVEAKQGLAKLSGPEFAKVKPMLFMALSTLDINLDALLKAGSQKEFDERLKNLSAVGGMIRSMQQTRKRGAG